MLVVFSVAQRELDRALDMLAWMGEIGPYKNHNIVILTSSKVSLEDTRAIAGFAQDMFGRVEAIHQREVNEEPWPANANAMFRTAVNYLTSKGNNEPFLWFEMDMVPLRRGWLDAIETEYRSARKQFLGAYYDKPHPHINGGMVYPPDVARVNPAMVNATQKPFDLTRADIVLQKAHRSNLMVRSLANPATNTPHSFPDTASLSIVPSDCAIFHGCKDGTLIARLREQTKAEIYTPEQFAGAGKPEAANRTSLPRLAIAGLLKGNSPSLPQLLRSMAPVRKAFGDVHAFLCVNKVEENNMSAIRQWAKGMELTLNLIGDPRVLPQGRYAKMAALRNTYLDQIGRSGVEFDYLLALDFDIAGFADWSGLESLLKDETWDAAAVFGLKPRKELPHFHKTAVLQYKGMEYCYYDLLALESTKRERVLWLDGDLPARWFWHGTVPDETRFTNEMCVNLNNGAAIVPVNSAFGPATLFRWQKVKNLRYCEWATECEHQTYFRALREKGGKVVIAKEIVALYSDPFGHVPA